MPSGPPERRASRAAVRLDLLVYVEGRLTEEQYLTAWHRLYRGRVNVEMGDFRGAPLQLVQQAVEAKQSEERDERRGRGRAHDQIWCVFDRDEHPNLAQAFALARAEGINTAFSNPCLELWFLLHFQDQTADIHRHAAQHLAKEHLKCAKALSQEAVSELVARYEDAKRRAVALERKHAGDGSPPGSNPSSGVWQLVDQIRGLQ